MTATPFYNRGGGEHNEGKRTLAYYPKIDDKYCFLDAMASLESMLESELSFQQIQMIWKYYDDDDDQGDFDDNRPKGGCAVSYVNNTVYPLSPLYAPRNV